MRIDILTIFPKMFNAPFSESMIKLAKEKGIVQIKVWDIRGFSHDKHKKVDDTPYGGGAGMVMMPGPIVEAVESVNEEIGSKGRSKLILTTPKGQKFNQEKAKELSEYSNLIFICGHYEGIDERVNMLLKPEEISIGDYVLTGGELASMVIIDSVARLIPGVVGDSESVKNDSFYDGVLDWPHYTRPVDFRGLKVPEVLRSGNHKKVEDWRKKEALKKTENVRPDLIK